MNYKIYSILDDVELIKELTYDFIVKAEKILPSDEFKKLKDRREIAMGHLHILFTEICGLNRFFSEDV